MKSKFGLILMVCLILTDQNNPLGQQSPGMKTEQVNQLSQVKGNKLEIITYLVGHDRDGNTRLGAAVAGIGDVNQDGYDDVLIGNAVKGPGEAWLLFGGAKMDSLPDLIFQGENAKDQFGSNVAGGGDINGDHAPDFLINAPQYNHSKGRVYLYWGGALLDTLPDLIITGETGCRFGHSIITDDVNGDYRDDILISSPYFSEFRKSNLGKVYLYYGGNLLDTIPDWSNKGDSARINFGHTLAIGDINGDQKKDILIGSLPTTLSSSGYDSIMTNTEIFLNKAGFDTTSDYSLFYSRWGDQSIDFLFCADLNRDGIDDFHTFFGGSKIYFGSQQLELEPDGHLEYWPLTAIHIMRAAGDVNGDGYTDILGGAPHPVFWRGSVQLFLGSKNINPTVDWVAGGTGMFGWDIDGAGDVNGDGYDDIIFSNSILPFSGIGEGQVYIMAGNPNLQDLGATNVIDWPETITANDFQLYQNYPNPFNSSTQISYRIPNRSQVHLTIIDILGKEVKRLVNHWQEAGEYTVTWDSRDFQNKELPSGMYFYELKTDNYTERKSMLLIR